MTVCDLKVRHRKKLRPAFQHYPSLDAPILFVPHPAFKHPNVEARLRKLAPLAERNSPPADYRPGLTFVSGFVSQPLLTPGEEESLFCWMNYHRYRAEQLRRRALRAKSPRPMVAEIKRRLQLANDLRNRIVASNLRLVVSVAKRLSRSLDQMSELISEGVLPLIRAVELFDISLGNRFSTYATWAVRNQMLRMIKRSAARTGGDIDVPQPIESLPARPVEFDVDPTETSAASQVARLIETLPEREQRVLRARFGLAGEPSGQSLADVARQVGLSKERVRQIVLKSLDELRSRLIVSAGAASSTQLPS